MLGEKISLCLSDGMIALIVDQNDFHRKPVCYDGLQLLQIHHDASVSLQTYNIRMLILILLLAVLLLGHRSPDSCRKSVAHAGHGIIVQETASLFDHPALMSCHTAGSVAGDGGDPGRQCPADDIKYCVGVGRNIFCLLLLCHHRIFLLPVLTDLHPVCVNVTLAYFDFLVLLRRLQQLRQEYPCIRMDRLVHMNGGLFHFSGIDVHHDDFCISCPGLPVISRYSDGQTVSDGKHQIRILYRKVSRSVSHISATSHVERVVGFDEIDGIPVGADRNSQQIHHLPEFLHGSCQADPRSRIDHRSLCPAQLLQNILGNFCIKGLRQAHGLLIPCLFKGIIAS